MEMAWEYKESETPWKAFGEFEILRILFFFVKKDMEFGSVRKIGLVENN